MRTVIINDGGREEQVTGDMLSKMGNFTLVVQVMHKSYCSH